MYGFGGVGQVELRFGQMSPTHHGGTNEQPNNQQGKIANGLWKAEMSKKYLQC